MACIFLCKSAVSYMFSMPVAIFLISNLTLLQDEKLITVIPASLRDRPGLEILYYSAEARRVQSIIDLKVKEAGGPQYVTKLDLVSASALNMKRENRR